MTAASLPPGDDVPLDTPAGVGAAPSARQRYRLSTSVLAGGFLGYAVSGGAMSLYGPAAPLFRRTFGVSEFVSGLPTSVLPLLAFVGAIVWAVSFRRIGAGRLLAAGLVALGAGSLTVAAAGSMTQVLVGVAVVGLGFGIITNGLNTVFPRDTNPRTALHVGLMNAAFAAAAVALPLVLVIGGRPAAFGVVGVTALAAVGILRRTPQPPIVHVDASLPRASRRPLITFGLLFAAYGATETASSAWLATYLASLGWSEAAGARWTSGFWLVFTVSRFVFAPVLQRRAPAEIARIVLPLTVVGLLAASLAPAAPYAMLTAAFLLGPMFPLGILWMTRDLADRPSATNVVVLSAMTGGAMGPLLVGATAAWGGTSLIPLAIAALATVLTTISWRLGRVS